MIRVLSLLLLIGIFGTLPPGQSSPDAPEYTQDSAASVKTPDTYEQALTLWKTPEDVHGWIISHFSYDMARALRLSETQRAKNEPLRIYDPAELFRIKTGVCVDLSRFAVETLRQIDPRIDPKYLMIEFDPVQIEGNTLRFHWLVSFKRDGKRYLFADSNRPGHLAGPYDEMQVFIDEYARYRKRKIVAFREMDSYRKEVRRKRQVREMKP